MARPTLLAVSHGTSDAEGARAIAALVDGVADAMPDVVVRSAFVDVQEPDAADVVPAVDGPVVIVPLLLSSGFHVHHDLHGIAATRADAVVADPLGPDRRLAAVLAERLADGLADRLAEQLWHHEPAPLPTIADRPVILAVAGSRDPRSLTDAEGMASLLRERVGRPVELAYLAARQPDLPTALAAHPDADVVTYLLAHGYFFDLAAKHAAGRVLSAPLLDRGTVPEALVDLVRARYEEAERRLAASGTSPSRTTGRVTLVGAGPGDAGLLTRRGLAALQDADIIVADRLGARAVLAQLVSEGVRIDAEVIDVGKLPGHHPVPQDGINALLVEHAASGRRVVRLKGGDPFIFGRGREEQLFCEAAGIPVEVIPGVTSAIAVPALAGIPLTHPGLASSFTVVSGHDQIAELPGGPEHTVVLLMGVNTLGHSASVLAAGARGEDCPAAIIEDGHGERERVTIGTLGTIAHLAAAARVRSPAVVVIGNVVALSPHEAPDADVRAPGGDPGASAVRVTNAAPASDADLTLSRT